MSPTSFFFQDGPSVGDAMATTRACWEREFLLLYRELGLGCQTRTRNPRTCVRGSSKTRITRRRLRLPLPLSPLPCDAEEADASGPSPSASLARIPVPSAR